MSYFSTFMDLNFNGGFKISSISSCKTPKMSRERDQSYFGPSPSRMQEDYTEEVIRITPELLSEVSQTAIRNLSDLPILDLHMKDRKGKIRRIEQMHRLPNLRQLNFSFNAIVAIEGLERLSKLLELNLAENDISVIENLDSLRLLEKLNLSGNKIRRIPESITRLSRLTNLRIANNQLEVTNDLRHLGNLPKLEKLRIDRNPFSSRDTSLFAVHCISSLVELDRVPITQDHRETAARMFGTSTLAQLRSQLAEEESKLFRMRSEINRSPERQQAQRRLDASQRNTAEFAEAQRDLDEEEVRTAQKLHNIRVVEAQVSKLRADIESLSSAGEKVFTEVSQSFGRAGGGSGTAGAHNVSFFDMDSPDTDEPDHPDTSFTSRPHPPAPQRYSSPVHARSVDPATGDSGHTPSRFTSGPSTPAAISHHPPPPPHTASAAMSAATSMSTAPRGNVGKSSSTSVSTLAAQEVSRLSDQLEALTVRLLSSEKEKGTLQRQVDQAKQVNTQQSAQLSALTHASTSHADGYSHREADLQRLNNLLTSQLKENQEQLAQAQNEASIHREQVLRVKEELELAQAEARKNASQRDMLKQEVELYKADNEKKSKEMLDLRRTVIDHDSMTTEAAFHRLSQASSTTETFHNHANRLEIASQRSELDSLKNQLSQLTLALEKSMRETSAATEAKLLVDTEVDVLKGKLSVSEEVTRANKSRIGELEHDLRRLKGRFEECQGERNAFEEECARLSTSLAILEAEMDTFLRTRENTPHKRSSHVVSKIARTATVGIAAEANNAGQRDRMGESRRNNVGLFQSPMKARVRPSEENETYITANAKATTTAVSGGAVGDIYDVVSSEEEGSECSDDSGAIQPGQLQARVFSHKHRKSSTKKSKKEHYDASNDSFFHRPFYATQPEQQPARYKVSKLEVAAAEVVALVLMQEIEANMPAQPTSASAGATKGATRGLAAHSRGLSVHDQTNLDNINNDRKLFLKDACIRAALRVIHSSTSFARREQFEKQRFHTHHVTGATTTETAEEGQGESEGGAEADKLNTSMESGEFGVGESKRSEQRSPQKKKQPVKPKQIITLEPRDIYPFHALGSREFLSTIIAETHAGMAEIEESDKIKQDVRLLENLVRELETKSLTMESSLATKEYSLGALQKHCDDTKSQAEAALNDLAFQLERLQNSRDEITKTETEKNLVKRELDLVRQALQEAVSMSDIEHQNIHAIRNKLVELKHEQAETEQRILICKESCLKEEDRLRTTKSNFSEELRIMKMDLNKYQSDAKAKHQKVEGLEAQRRSLVEEIAIKKRDSELNLSIIEKAHEEEARKMNNARMEVSALRLEIDQLTAKRRKLESDLQHLEERFASEAAAGNNEEQEMKRRLTQLEKSIQSADKKLREAKGKLSEHQGEETILRHSVEELRRQQGDLERAAEQRRRTSEEELTLAKQELHRVMQAARSADGQSLVKRAELDNLLVELRSGERRLDEIKRQVHEQEIHLECLRDTTKVMDLDRERRHKDAVTYRKEEEELRHQTQLLRTSMEHQTRNNEDLRRKLVALKEEETSLIESESKMRTALIQARKAIGDSQSELDEVRAASERERRALADVHTKKTVVEAETNRMQDALRFEAERVAQESQKRAELESVTARSQEELSRVQKALASIEKRVEDASRREEDLRRQETTLRTQLEKLRLDTEGLTNAQANEKSSVNAAREELRDLNLEIRRNKENLRVVQQEVQTGQLGLEARQAQRNHLEDIKDELTAELHRLRESSRLELQRSERLEATYQEVQQRLAAVRMDLTHTEKNYDRTRHLTVEEEQHVQSQRRELRKVLDDLGKAEKTLADTHLQMYEERQRALLEIGQLGQAKQSAQTHVFLANEAQRRLDSRAALPNQGITLHAPKPSNLTSNSLGSLNMPDYLLSQNTQTLYKATPTLAATGVKLDSAPSSFSQPVRDYCAKPRDPSPPRRTSPVRNSYEGLGINPGAGARPVTTHPTNITTGRATGDTALSSLQQEVEKLKRQSAVAISSATSGSRN